MARQLFLIEPGRKRGRQERKAHAAAVRRLRAAGGDETVVAPDPLPLTKTSRFSIAFGTYWSGMSIRLPAYQAASCDVSGLYPYLADEGLGHRGSIVGVDLNADVLWQFTPWDTYMEGSERGSQSTNVLFVGAYRSGKSGTAKQLVLRSIPFGHKAVVPSDSKGEWVELARQIDGAQIIELGGAHINNRINPLARGPRQTGTTDAEHEMMVYLRRQTMLVTVVNTVLGNKKTLEPEEVAALHWALDVAIDRTNDEPTITEVRNILVSPDANLPGFQEEFKVAASRPRFVLDRFVTGDLRNLFEGKSTVEFDADAPLVVVDTSALFERSDLAAQITSICTSSWIQAVISDRGAKRTRYVVREEGWRDMTSLEALLMYQQWLKLSRHYGISNIIILHKMGDFDVVGPEGSQERALAYSIAADIENKFVFRQNAQEYEALVKRLRMGPMHAKLTLGLATGVFVAYVGTRAYVVDAFATSTSWERELFNTDSAVEAGIEQEAMPQDFVDINALERLWPVEVSA